MNYLNMPVDLRKCPGRLRILTSVERKERFSGLNLTYGTMLSVVKYFHKYKEGNSLIYNLSMMMIIIY